MKDRSLIFEQTLQHPILGEFIEFVSLEWLLRLANPEIHAKSKTDLGTWEANPELVGLDDLYENIVKNGMRDPFIIGVGRVSRKIRLEAGNHRVRALLKFGHKHAPAVAYVGDSAISNLGNGKHEGEMVELLIPPPKVDIMGPYPIKTYAKPSVVIAQIPFLGVVPQTGRKHLAQSREHSYQSPLFVDSRDSLHRAITAG